MGTMRRVLCRILLIGFESCALAALCALPGLAAAADGAVSVSAVCRAAAALDNQPPTDADAQNGKDGAILKEVVESDVGDSLGVTSYFFDRRGRLIRHEYAGKTLDEWRYSGNSTAPTSLTSLHDRLEFETNADGFVVRDRNGEGSTLHEYSFACDGDRVVVTSRTPDGRPDDQRTYSNGHIVERLQPPDATTPEKTTWTYRDLPGGKKSVEERGFVGDRNAKLAVTVYRADGRVESVWAVNPSMTMKFGSDVRWELPASTDGTRITSAYTDDKHGNWVTRVKCFHHDASPNEQDCYTTKRTIKYW